MKINYIDLADAVALVSDEKGILSVEDLVDYLYSRETGFVVMGDTGTGAKELVDPTERIDDDEDTEE